ncbi:MAG: uroporphyrinogen decarboxylase family protein [Bellilinea sp.]
MKTNLAEFVFAHKQRISLLNAVYPALDWIGKSMPQAVDDPLVHIQAGDALAQRYPAAFALPAWDFTIEAETYGAQITFDTCHPPAILGRLVKERRDLDMLIDPKPGHKRTTIPLTTARLLKNRAQEAARFVLGAMVGPFTLAGQLFGEEEVLALMDTDDALLEDLLKMVMRFLPRYAIAFKFNDADGLLLSEPLAGRLSPAQMERFSLPHIERIIRDVQSVTFAVILHSPLARPDHLPVIYHSGAGGYLFGDAMDIRAALEQADAETVVAGNLDIGEVFLNASAESVYQKTSKLLAETKDFPRFVLAAAQELPPGTPAANLVAYQRALADFNAEY